MTKVMRALSRSINSRDALMRGTQAELLYAVDPVQLGARIQAARKARGMTQAELAGSSISAAYVSRIECGNRRPTPPLLVELAERLQVSVNELLDSAAGVAFDDLRLCLDFAELALENGEAQEAEEQARSVAEQVDAPSAPELTARAWYLLGRALECLGRYDDAVDALDKALATAVALPRIDAVIALSRCYRELGDVSMAIEVAEAMEATLPELGLDATDEAVRLTSTVAAAYVMRGDLAYATRVCALAIKRAEALDSPSARSAAYWNASVAHAQRGQLREAVPLATKALSLLSEGSDTRNLARLRVDLGRLQLRAGQDLPEAVDHLQRATRDLETTSAAAVDLAASRVALADARLRTGDAGAALALALEVEAMEGAEIAHERAEAAMVRGQAEASQGNVDAAKEAYRRAADILASCDDNQFNAQLWFDLAELLQEVGEMQQAHLALHVAAKATGLQSRRQRITAETAVNA